MHIKLGPLQISIGEASNDKSPLKRIIMVRHGQSTGNAGIEDSNIVGDHNLRLTTTGIVQAQEAGMQINYDMDNALVYTSPYRRTRETCQQAIIGSGAKNVRVFEDPRLREVDHGYDDVEAQEEKRKIHGWFYYRFSGGESPGDCYDRTSLAIDSIIRQAIRKNKDTAIIFSHGLTIRCIVARFLHLTVEEFEQMANPKNGAIIEIAHHVALNVLTNTVNNLADTPIDFPVRHTGR
jgi:broad specificity phosphatase PhoE